MHNDCYVDIMRNVVIAQYPNSTKWLQKVTIMSTAQIIAIYHRIQEGKAVPKDKGEQYICSPNGQYMLKGM